ncbi:MAG TPA: sigma-70 family RNA polymerase sigma factor, partial [Gemmataceae bacterium]|nr:sigma-70 family RNA polymerase sigma factor [Gemmataceae bacterium]
MPTFAVPNNRRVAYYPLMGENAPLSSDDSECLLQKAAAGDQDAWGRLLSRHRQRLHSMVSLRLDPRLAGRIDPSDVLQEAFLAATLQLKDFAAQRNMPVFLWLRLVAGQKLAGLHRHHLGKKMRDAGREVSLYKGALPQASSAALAARLMGNDTAPSEAARKAELVLRLETALNTMDPLDREVLVLRHFEELSNGEAAQVLDIQQPAASKRYIRALQRLKDILRSMP